MNLIKVLFSIVLLGTIISCGSGNSRSVDVEDERAIYLKKMIDPSIPYKQWEYLVNSVNENPEGLHVIPDSIVHVFSPEKNLEMIFCRSLLKVGDYYMGDFILKFSEKRESALVTFSLGGDILDTLFVKHSVDGQNERFKSFYSRTTYFYEYEESEKPNLDIIRIQFEIDILDPGDLVEHPDLATKVRTDLWEITKDGVFILKGSTGSGGSVPE